jgi:heme-degrading monooxygenase HmoA
VTVVVVFRARRTPEGLGDLYASENRRMAEIATKMPGYISHKGYVAEDGERLTLFEWESAETLRAWATHPEHVPVKQLGRERFYTEYRLQVCEVVRDSTFAKTERS